MVYEPDNIRVGGGLQLKVNTAIVGPYRDAGGAAPWRMDESAGIMEADESIRDLQIGEGTEEIVYLQEDGDSYEIVLPDIIADTAIEGRVMDVYSSALQDDSSPLPVDVTDDDVRYMDAEIRIPSNSDTITFGEYTTGYTMEEPEDGRGDRSMELVNYLDANPPEGAVPVDLENFPAGDTHIHLDRIVYEIDLETADAQLYRSGEQIHDGDVESMLAFMDDINDHADETVADGYTELPDDKEEPEVPATVKVQEAIAGSPTDDEDWTLHDQVVENLLGGEYRERVRER